MGDSSQTNQLRTLTYADQVKGKQQLPVTSVDLSTLPIPTEKEGKPAVVLPESFYLEGCDIWRFSLIGRLDLKGVNFQDVKDNLEHQWQLGQGRVQFVPMNRVFFIIKLQSQADKDKLLNAEAWFFDHQKLNLIEWFPGFDTDKQRTSHASVWVKFPGLPVEFWIEKTLLAMAKSLGTPIVVDRRTLAHEYGHFTPVLVDINFVEPATDAIHVIVGGLDFWQPVEIQKKPKFCSHCKIIEHNDQECKKQPKVSAVQQSIVPVQQRNIEAHPQNTGVRINNKGSQGSNAGGEWQVAKRKKGKNAPKIPVVPEVIANRVVEVENLEFTSQLVKTKQLEEAFAKSKAAFESAFVELEKTKQVQDSNSVLIHGGKVGETRPPNTKSGTVGIKIPNPDRTLNVPSTPLCDQLLAGEYILTANKFDALNSVPVSETHVMLNLGLNRKLRELG